MAKNSGKTSLGDFLAWSRKNKWWLRGFEGIHRVDEDFGKGTGWGFTHCTSMGFVSDADINSEIPEKTAMEWGRWGR